MSDGLEVLIFSTDNTTGCQTSKLVRLQLDPLSLQMKKLRFLRVVCKHLLDTASCQIRPGWLWNSQVSNILVLTVSVMILWFDKYQVKHSFPLFWSYRIVCFWVSGNVGLQFNPLNAELNPICYLLALLGAHHFLDVSRIRVKSLTLRQLMSYIYGAPILDVSRSHTTTQHSR